MAPVKKIGWQKYEDVIENQMSSPMFIKIIKNLSMQNIDDEDKVEDEDEDEESTGQMHESSMMLPITSQLVEDITMLANFDCWMGHTNFDITHKFKAKLDKIPGIEVLKVCSRYRFFIGVGNMFEFKNVRSDIDLAIKGDFDE
jgi:hypothetical protein